MSINTTMMIGDDGKPLTPDQVTIARLKKEYSDLEKRVAKLEAKNLTAEQKASRDSMGGVQH